MSLGLSFTCFLHLFLLVLFGCFFPLLLLFDFSMQDVSLNNFKSQSLAFSISAPVCLFAPLFPPSRPFFFPSFSLSCSLTLCAQTLKEAPNIEKCGCLRTRMRERESVPESLTLPLCQCLPLGCQWQSEFICCAVTGLMIDVAPANSKPIRRLM